MFMSENQKPLYGGLALIEGVMMRSKRFYSIACRAPNGKIVLKTEPVSKTWIGRQRWLQLPFLRGTFALLDMMTLGVKALNFSAHVQSDPAYLKKEDNEDLGTNNESSEIAADGKPTHTPETIGISDEGSELIGTVPQSDALLKAAMIGAAVLGLGIGVLLFIVSPVWVAQLFTFLGVENETTLNVIEGIIKASLFLGYVGLVGLWEEIKNVYRYHGAEHKSINALEAGEELTVENAKRQTRLHPRCGTTFAIIVLAITIVVFTAIPRTLIDDSVFMNLLLRTGLKIAALPVIAGLAFETIRLAGKMKRKTFAMALYAPGMWTQYLTTREPRNDQLEVALVALRAVKELEEQGSEEKSELTGITH